VGEKGVACAGWIRALEKKAPGVVLTTNQKPIIKKLSRVEWKVSLAQFATRRVKRSKGFRSELVTNKRKLVGTNWARNRTRNPKKPAKPGL
jgi:hypothetical protein